MFFARCELQRAFASPGPHDAGALEEYAIEVRTRGGLHIGLSRERAFCVDIAMSAFTSIESRRDSLPCA